MSHLQTLRDMFTEMVIAKNISKVDEYYHPEFRLYTNGQEQDLAEFRAGHERVYPTAISYHLEYDEHAWVESEFRLAGRIWITTARPGHASTRIEVILIAEFRDGLIWRLRELTWPDWSQLAELASYKDG